MLFRGFLTLSTRVNEVPIVFKTINQTEHELVELYTSFVETEREQAYRTAYLLAYSVFLFNRVNVLTDRENYIPMLVDEFINLPQVVVESILRRLQKLNDKALDEIDKVEPYSYGSESRRNWIAYRNMSLNDPRCTGISGTENLGINTHQKLWIFFNNSEDKEEEFERQWSIAKFQASVHAPKEVKRIDSKDKNERKQRKRRKEALYRGKGKEVVEEGPEGEIRVSNESVDDLMDQMKQSIEGQKDYHDQVIERHEEKIREEHRKARKRREQKRKQAKKKRQDRLSQVSDEESFVFYDEEEVQEKVQEAEKRKRQAREEGMYQEQEQFDQKEEHLKKWRILDEDNPEDQSQQSGPDEEEPDSSVDGTLLEDHYRVVEDDLSSPDQLEHPDLLDDD